MYFEAIWTNSAGSTGTSYSRNFTVMADFNAQGSGTFNLAEKFKDSSPAKSEISAQATSSPTSSSPGQLPSSSTATAAPVSSSSGGLSTGAIAGIAVGCGVVGLAIIAGTIWFCCRRRRQDGMAGYGEARNRTQELMAEKEANGGVDVAPHSPYSDDGTGGLTGNGVHHHTDSLMAGGAAGVGMAAAADYQHHSPPSAIDRSYTPYSDRPIASMGSPATQRASIGAGRTESAHASEHDLEPHAAPGGIRSATSASQYAHLVEDGMTEDEIRRIEEEERQLDAAIQQAGTRR
ncbi:hypothetical protein GQ53DRAFT_408813 [Thozetella sp. PMI_491]|nr:hypothetical protein GQ53DRAFT_408813 [Thozetella sp. PMI_491]